MRRMALVVLIGCGGGSSSAVVIEAPGAALVAFQDGDGPWRQLTLSPEGRAEATSDLGYYGIARICPDPEANPGQDPAFRGSIDLRFDTRGRTFKLSCVRRSSDISVLSGATTVNTELFVDFDQLVASEPSYSTSVAKRTHDIVAMLPGTPTRMMIERGVDLTVDRVVDLVVDVDGVEMPTITPQVTGANAADISLYSDLNTETGTYALLDTDPTTVAIPPPSLLVETDGAAVGASAHGCTAQRSASAAMTLAIPAAMMGLVDRSGASFSADPNVDWEFVRLFLSEERVFARTSISTFADVSWLEVRGVTDALPLPDLTTLPGWTSDLPGLIADGAAIRSELGIVRGQFDGELDQCGVSAMFAW